MAFDTRFAVVLVRSSGEGGAKPIAATGVKPSKTYRRRRVLLDGRQLPETERQNPISAAGTPEICRWTPTSDCAVRRGRLISYGVLRRATRGGSTTRGSWRPSPRVPFRLLPGSGASDDYKKERWRSASACSTDSSPGDGDGGLTDGELACFIRGLTGC
jgi:hypothetical protein